MSQFIVSVISAVFALSYYLFLMPGLQYLPDHIALFGVLPAFFFLHLTLRRVLASSTIHVLTLILCAALFTFYRTFNNGMPFLYGLVGLHALVFFAALLTAPVTEKIATETDTGAENEEKDEHEK